MRSELADIAQRFAEHPGLQAKAALSAVTDILGPTDWVGGPGDDAAALPDAGGFQLAAGEAMWPPFVAADPYGAGIGSVVANVNDIAAMGGQITALVDAITGPEATVRRALEGLRHAAALYRVRVVGGHLSLWDGPPSLSVFALGHAQRLLSARNVGSGQALLAAFCLDGRQRPDFPYFSSIAERGEALAADVQVLASLAAGGHALACKDVSIAGTLGSLAMLLEPTGAGAVVDLDAVPRPSAVPLADWLFTFPTFGFLLTCLPDQAGACRRAFEDRGLACAPIGSIEATGGLQARLAGEVVTLIDLQTGAVTGLRASVTGRERSP